MTPALPVANQPKRSDYIPSELLPKNTFLPDNFNNIHRHSILYRSDRDLEILKPNKLIADDDKENNNRSSIIDSLNNKIGRNQTLTTSPQNYRNQLKLYHRFGGSIQNLPKPVEMLSKKISASEFQLNESHKNKRTSAPEAVGSRGSWFTRSRWLKNAISSPTLSSNSKTLRKSNGSSSAKRRSMQFQWRNIFPLFSKQKSDSKT